MIGCLFFFLFSLAQCLFSDEKGKGCQGGVRTSRTRLLDPTRSKLRPFVSARMRTLQRLLRRIIRLS